MRSTGGPGGNIEGECSAERNLAIIFLATGRYDTAIEYFEECLINANQLDDAALSVHCMEALEGLGDAYFCLKMPERANEMY